MNRDGRVFFARRARSLTLLPYLLGCALIVTSEENPAGSHETSAAVTSELRVSYLKSLRRTFDGDLVELRRRRRPGPTPHQKERIGKEFIEQPLDLRLSWHR